MGTQAGTRRKEKKQEQQLQTTVAVVMQFVAGFLLYVLPKTGTAVIIVLVIDLFFLSYLSWVCFGLEATKLKRAAFFACSLLLTVAMGYLAWPSTTVSPKKVRFAGFPNETFNFSVRNGRDEDIYNVEIPFLIGYNKHLDAKFSAMVMPSGEPSQPLHSDYYYCYGKRGVVDKVVPNEQEVLVIKIEHLPPSGMRTFTITYAGGEKLDTKPGHPIFSYVPNSYSPTQGTIDIRGDYRICKIMGE
jgi:hypothetical protein